MSIEKSLIDLMVGNNKNLFRDDKAIPSVSCDSDLKWYWPNRKMKTRNYIKTEKL